MSGMLLLMLLLSLKYYPEKKKFVYLRNKNEKMLQIDLNSDLKQ